MRIGEKKKKCKMVHFLVLNGSSHLLPESEKKVKSVCNCWMSEGLVAVWPPLQIVFTCMQDLKTSPLCKTLKPLPPLQNPERNLALHHLVSF